MPFRAGSGRKENIENSLQSLSSEDRRSSLRQNGIRRSPYCFFAYVFLSWQFSLSGLGRISLLCATLAESGVFVSLTSRYTLEFIDLLSSLVQHLPVCEHHIAGRRERSGTRSAVFMRLCYFTSENLDIISLHDGRTSRK